MKKCILLGNLLHTHIDLWTMISSKVFLKYKPLKFFLNGMEIKFKGYTYKRVAKTMGF